MPRTHYHIGNGNPGCLFDSISGPYTNHREAERDASGESRDHVAQHNDPDFARDHMTRWVGKDKNGRPALYICEIKSDPYAAQYYWEIFPCTDADCLIQDRWETW